MTKYLKKCISCGKYTMINEICPYCSDVTKNPHPPKFSINDHYGKYRRELKKLVNKKEKNA